MDYFWYLVCNRAEFEALNLYSKTYVLDLEDIGQKPILVTKGNILGITYNGIYLPVKLNSKNPFEFEGHAVYEAESGNIYLGIQQ